MSASHPLPIDPQPETLVPASRIMRERDEWKAAWAQELTRAEQLERKLAAVHSTTIDQLTDHCAAQGAYIARQDAELKALRQFVRDVCEEIDESKLPDIDVIRDSLDEFVREHGRPCDECDGQGRTRVETDRFSDRLGHYTSWRLEDCGACRGGRLPR